MKRMMLLLACVATVVQAQAQRERVLMNADWKFAKGHPLPEKDFNYGRALSFSKIAFLQESTMLEDDQESRLTVPHTQDFDDSKWEEISLPHDWGMLAEYAQDQFKVKGYRKLGGRTPENSIGWYRKTFKMNAEKGSRYHLEFEGIFRDAEVWINGILLGRNLSGYTPAQFDVTECLNYGKDQENVITVRVDATHSELWSYEGAGIYRNVWLTKTASVYVPQWGTFVQSAVDADAKKATVNAAVEITNDTDKPADIRLVQTIRNNKGEEVTSTESSLSVPALETIETTGDFTVNNPVLWDLDHPHLYKLYTEVWQNGKKVDEYVTRFGIRTIRFDADNGFFLNGKRVQIQGVCCHQDHAGVGAAVPDRLNFWRIDQLKTYGVNAYRASHNPPTVSVLEACDSLGMLVLDELRVLSSTDEGIDQMRTIIKRDRNNPSVIAWCMGNEEPAIQGNDKGRMILRRMKEIQHKMDPTRLCTAAMNGSWGEGFTYEADIQGSNYYHIGDVDAVHKKFPDLPILLTEEGSTVTTRGIYETSPEKGFHQAYDRDRPGWGATAQEWMRYVDARKFVAGAFVWTGFDYGGESTIHFWPGVVSHFGILDYCGFPKDAYWFYKSWWTNEPVVHIFPHWNGIGTDSVDVHVYTNLEDVELFLNGKSLGKKQVEKYDIPAWRVKYTPGKLEAKGKKDGKRYTQVFETTGKPAALKIMSETGSELCNDGRDVAVCTVQVLDAKKRLVPDASNKVVFEIENGTILGVGNGHPSSHEPDQFAKGEQVYRNAFGGLLLVIVKPDNSGKPVVLKAFSDGLTNGEITLTIN